MFDSCLEGASTFVAAASASEIPRGSTLIHSEEVSQVVPLDRGSIIILIILESIDHNVTVTYNHHAARRRAASRCVAESGNSSSSERPTLTSRHGTVDRRLGELPQVQ